MCKKLLFIIFYVFLITSCKRSEEAELLFQKIISFEILGIKFGHDSINKDSSGRELHFGSMFLPQDKNSHVDVEKSIAGLSKLMADKIVHIKSELTAAKIISKLEKRVSSDLRFLVEELNSENDFILNDIKSKYLEGSGFLISWDGHIVTSAQFVDGAGSIMVTLNKKTFPAKIVGADLLTNIAVLKIDVEKAMEPLYFANLKDVRLGQTAVTFGNPIGLNNIMFKGIVNALPDNGSQFLFYDDFIQISTPFFKGCVGGPVVDLQGFIIGMNTLRSDNAGMGFVIPADTVRNVVEQIIKNGEIERSWFGGSFQNLTSDIAEIFKYSEKEPAVLITSIESDSPAYKHGFIEGDIIVSINDIPAYNVEYVYKSIASIPFGDRATLKYYRDGKTKTERVNFNIKRKREKRVPLSPDWTGMTISHKSIVGIDNRLEQKLYVAGIERLSPAYRSGVEPNDIILSVNKKQISSLKDYENEVGKKLKDDGGKVLFLVSRESNGVFENKYVLVSHK